MRILLVSSRFPLPPWRGNQLRTLQWLDALDDHERLVVCPAAGGETMRGEHDFEVTTIPRDLLGGAAGLGAALVRGRPVQEGIYASRTARREIAEVVLRWRPDLVVVQMVRCAWAADVVSVPPSAPPILFDAIDCMALHYDRRASLAFFPVRPAWRFEARRCRRREAELVRRAAVTTAVSSRDLAALDAGPRGMVVPVTGGVELDGRRSAPPQPTVLLSGNLGYRPTVDAALWFGRRVWPAVRELVPTARWVLAGARPAPAVARLAKHAGVEVHGDVDDLAPYLRRATVAIAPMAGGSGVPLKILEALAAGVPVVADRWAASGLEDVAAVAVAGGATAWIGAVHRLLVDPEAARQQSERGSETWRSFYEPGLVRQRIRQAVSRAVG